MAKMNWDRVRNWARVRGDLSDMELADERDERWFEREGAREAARAARSSETRTSPKGPAAPRTPTCPGKEKGLANSFSGKQGARRLAASIGVTPEELAAARQAEIKASSGLTGVPPKARLQEAARQLRITPDDVRMLRKGLNGQLPASKTRLASLVRIAARSDSSVRSQPTYASTGRLSSTVPFASPTRPTQRLVAVSTTRGLAGATPVYVTTWGNVVHFHHDCHSARGFRHKNEPDPDIYRVPANDPCCRGRRVCGTCTNVDEPKARQLSRLLVGLHGQPFDERDWERCSWDRPLPSGHPIARRR